MCDERSLLIQILDKSFIDWNEISQTYCKEFHGKSGKELEQRAKEIKNPEPPKSWLRSKLNAKESAKDAEKNPNKLY